MDRRLGKPIKKIILLEKNAAGTATPVTFYQRKRKGKKSSRLLRGLEKRLRRIAQAQESASGNYLTRHERSSQKKKNGWLRDMGKNVTRAAKKGIDTYTD